MPRSVVKLSDQAQCLLTHKCGCATHKLAYQMRNALREYGVTLLLDPFRPVDDINARIETLEIDALLFLSDPESLCSKRCRQELAAARSRDMPIFTVRVKGSVPEELSQRIYPSLTDLDSASFESEMGRFAVWVHTRVLFWQKIRSLSDQSPEDSRQAAQCIYDESDRTILAEFVRQLGNQYKWVQDSTTQFLIAKTIGKARSPQAGVVLLELFAREGDHPLARHGVIEALEMVSHEVPNHPIANEIWSKLALLM